MRPLVYILLVALIALGIYSYYSPEFRHGLEQFLGGTLDLPETQTTRVYKWQDAQGHWQLTDQPPPQGIPYETQEYRGDVNVLPVPPQLRDE